MNRNNKDILLITNYYHFESEKLSTRYRGFANVIASEFSLEIVTSSFWHLNKKHRDISSLNISELPYKVTFCHEPGYKRNIGLKRIHSYTIFGKNVLKYLKTRKKPDLIILSVPSLAVADYVSLYANENHIPVILDIQDLWPEAFKMALDIPMVSDILFFPMKKQAERIYSRADTIMAVSDTYVDFGLRFNPGARGLSIYIGTDPALFSIKDKGEAAVRNTARDFQVVYIGALGHSYDIKIVISAIRILKERGYGNILFKVIGSGVLQEEFRNYAKANGVRCEFTGQLEYGAMMEVLHHCDIAVNPIIGKSVSTIINKVSDYAAAGLPVINTQNSDEYKNLLDQYSAGINVENGNAEALAAAIEELYTSPDKLEQMAHNAQHLFYEKFDRSKSYPKLVDEIKYLLDV